MVTYREDIELKMSSEKTSESTPAGGKKGKKKAKKQPMSLNAFLNESSSTPASNWADVTEDIDPSEITTQWPEVQKSERRSNFDRSKLPSAPRASTAADIDMRRLPSKPPYTVYLGNLSYECSEENILQFFERKKLVAHSVRLPLESEKLRLRGFGYAEFSNISDLKEVLLLNGEKLLNRPMQIDIAEWKSVGGGGGPDESGRGGDFRGRPGDDDRTERNWRHDNENESPSSLDRDRDYGRHGDRDRGGRNYSGRAYGGNWSGGDGGHSRDDWFGRRDRNDDSSEHDRGRREEWQGGHDAGREGGYDGSRQGGFDGGRQGGFDSGRRGGFDGGRHRGFDGGRHGGYDSGRQGGYDSGRQGGYDSYSGRDDRYGGGGFRDPPPRREYGGNRYEGNHGRDYGGMGEDGREPMPERPRLKLQPRTKKLDSPADADSTCSPSAIFGGAKPVDTAAKEQEMEERLKRAKEDRDKQLKEREKEKKAVFGQATPVDTTSRDKQVEEKILRDKEALEQLGKRKVVEEDGGRGSEERRRHGSEEDRGGEGGHRRGSQDRGPPLDSGRGSSKERSDDQRGAAHGQDRGQWRGRGNRSSQSPHESGGGSQDRDQLQDVRNSRGGYERSDSRGEERKNNKDEGEDTGRRSSEQTDHDSALPDRTRPTTWEGEKEGQDISSHNRTGENCEDGEKTNPRLQGEKMGGLHQDMGSSSSEGTRYPSRGRGWEERKHGNYTDVRLDYRNYCDEVDQQKQYRGGGDRGGGGWRGERRGDDYRGRQAEEGYGRGVRGSGQGDHRRAPGDGEWGKREGEERDRYTEREQDSESGPRKGGGSGNAWAKGMPRSFGGLDKPVILLRKKVKEEVPAFSQPSRYAMLDNESGEGGGEEGMNPS